MRHRRRRHSFREPVHNVFASRRQASSPSSGPFLPALFTSAIVCYIVCTMFVCETLYLRKCVHIFKRKALCKIRLTGFNGTIVSWRRALPQPRAKRKLLEVGIVATITRLYSSIVVSLNIDGYATVCYMIISRTMCHLMRELENSCQRATHKLVKKRDRENKASIMLTSVNRLYSIVTTVAHTRTNYDALHDARHMHSTVPD